MCQLMSLSVQFSGVHCKPASSFWKNWFNITIWLQTGTWWVYKAVEWIDAIFVIKNFHRHFPTSGKLNTHSRESANVCFWFNRFFAPHIFQANMNSFSLVKIKIRQGLGKLYADFHISAIVTNNRASMLSSLYCTALLFTYRLLRSEN